MNMQVTPPVTPPAPNPAPAPAPVESPNPAPAPAPVESPTEPAPAPAPAPVDPATEEAASNARKGVQSRIDELTRQRHEAERRAQYWQNIATQEAVQAPAPSSAPAANSAPTPEQFTDYGQYIQALATWQASREVNRTLADSAEQQAEQLRVETFRARQELTRQNISDYDTVVAGSTVQVQPHVLQALVESDRGPELTYHLAKNPAELAALNSLGVAQANRRIGILEATLPPVVAPPAVRSSSAPQPASVTGAAGASNPDISTMSMDQYVQHRKAQGALWAR